MLCLHLSHAGTSTTGRTHAGAEISARSAGGEERKHQGGRVSGPGEPEEGGRGLSLTAALLRVGGAVGDGVVEGVLLESTLALSNWSLWICGAARIDQGPFPPSLEITQITCLSIVVAMVKVRGVRAYFVAAVPGLELRGQSNTGGQKDEHIEQIAEHHKERVTGPVDVDRRWNEIQQREHGECRGEHGVVDHGWVAGEGLGDQVTDEGHDEQGEDELSFG